MKEEEKNELNIHSDIYRLKITDNLSATANKEISIFYDWQNGRTNLICCEKFIGNWFHRDDSNLMDS